MTRLSMQKRKRERKRKRRRRRSREERIYERPMETMTTTTTTTSTTTTNPTIYDVSSSSSSSSSKTNCQCWRGKTGSSSSSSSLSFDVYPRFFLYFLPVVNHRDSRRRNKESVQSRCGDGEKVSTNQITRIVGGESANDDRGFEIHNAHVMLVENVVEIYGNRGVSRRGLKDDRGGGEYGELGIY